MSTATVNSVAMADIATINDITVPSGGSSGYAPSSTGLLIWGQDGAPAKPIPSGVFVGGSIPLGYSIYDPSPYTITKIDMYQNYMGILDSNGDLYTGGGSNTAYMGRSTTGSTPANNLYLAESNVADFCAHQYGFFVVKTDGTLWHTGNTGQFLSGVSATYYTFAQYGTDTDWVSVDATKGYPYTVYAVKGSGSSKYWYATGYSNYGATGQGTNSGRLYAWTRVKSAASTDLSESIEQMSAGPRGTCGVVTASGKIFTVGDGYYGHLGNGANVQNTYATQAGTATNWTKVYMAALGSFAINSNNEIYASGVNSTYYFFTTGAYSTNHRLFTQIGTHTDIEDIVAQNFSTSFNSNWKGVVVKKTDGKWYYNGANGFNQFGTITGSATTAATLDGDFTNSVYVQNPIGSSATQGTAYVTSEAENVAAVPGIVIAVS